MAFLRFICKKDWVCKKDALHQYLLSFKMLYNRVNGFHMDTNDAREVLKVCCHSAVVVAYLYDADMGLVP